MASIDIPHSQVPAPASLAETARTREFEVMTDRYTNAEWAAQIAETQKKVVVTKEKHSAPAIGSREFAETIDHTLLKLDATASQVDSLCSEARTEGFKVSRFQLHYFSNMSSMFGLLGIPILL